MRFVVLCSLIDNVSLLEMLHGMREERWGEKGWVGHPFACDEGCLRGYVCEAHVDEQGGGGELRGVELRDGLGKLGLLRGLRRQLCSSGREASWTGAVM